jgi:alpha-beta hydrolase superfamily lysophospholipase
MIKVENLTINGSKGKPIVMDLLFKETEDAKPVVIFCHGFKGFKNWGHYDLLATEFARHDFVFLKFNFSYNGTTLENPADFADLEAFGNNNFTVELDDLGLVIDFIEKNAEMYSGDKNKIFLIGHSRGGGIAILKTGEDKRIKKLSTWASVKDAADFFIHQDLEKWKSDGFIYTLNSRTQQNMPLNYQIYENYIANTDRLNIAKASVNINVPWLIVHGTNDDAVQFSSAEKLNQLNKNSVLLKMEHGNHTFGGKHPWEQLNLPEDAKIVADETILFFKK